MSPKSTYSAVPSSVSAERVCRLFSWLLLVAVVSFGAARARANSIPLYSFNSSAGANPSASLIQGSDGNFYGTTSQGGASDAGTVFKITSGGSLTTLYSFSFSDGSSPYTSLVVGSDGNFYGTTSQGGAIPRSS